MCVGGGGLGALPGSVHLTACYKEAHVSMASCAFVSSQDQFSTPIELLTEPL